MKLFEEFKEYENLWEAASSKKSLLEVHEEDQHDWRYNQPRKSFTKTFGSKTYDLADYYQLHDWIEANVQFQMKRYPNRYAHEDPKAGEYPSGVENTNKLRLVIMDNLIKQLEAEGADQRIIYSIRDQMDSLLGQHSSKQFYAKKREEVKAAAIAAFETFINSVSENYRLDTLSDQEKEAAKELFIAAGFNLMKKARWNRAQEEFGKTSLKSTSSLHEDIINASKLQLITDGHEEDLENHCLKQSFDVCTHNGSYLATISVIYDSYNDCAEVYKIEPEFDNDTLNKMLNTNGYINTGREFKNCVNTETMGDVVFSLIKTKISAFNDSLEPETV